MSAAWIRTLVIVGAVLLVEAASRFGLIDPFQMPAPSVIAIELGKALKSGQYNAAIVMTLSNVCVAIAMALIFGITSAFVIHSLRTVRRILEPFFTAYYAIPIFAFYPLFIVIFGLNSIPQIIIGFMAGVVAVIVNALTGLDRTPVAYLKTARILGMGRLSTIWKVVLPSASSHFFAGAKLAVAYSFTGVIGSEFIMARAGLGYEISNAYGVFDNNTMYPLILFVLLVAGTINMAMHNWELILDQRRGNVAQ